MPSLPKTTYRKLCRRAGILSFEKQTREAFNCEYTWLLQHVMRRIMATSQSARRTIVQVSDVLDVLRDAGTPVFGITDEAALVTKSSPQGLSSALVDEAKPLAKEDASDQSQPQPQLALTPETLAVFEKALHEKDDMPPPTVLTYSKREDDDADAMSMSTTNSITVHELKPFVQKCKQLPRNADQDTLVAHLEGLVQWVDDGNFGRDLETISVPIQSDFTSSLATSRVLYTPKAHVRNLGPGGMYFCWVADLETHVMETTLTPEYLNVLSLRSKQDKPSAPETNIPLGIGYVVYVNHRNRVKVRSIDAAATSRVTGIILGFLALQWE